MSNFTDAMLAIEADVIAWLVGLSGLKQALVTTFLKDVAAFALIVEQAGIQLVEDEVDTIRNWALGAIQAVDVQAQNDPKVAAMSGGQKLEHAAKMLHSDIQSGVLVGGNPEAKKLSLSHMMTVTQLAYNSHKVESLP